MTDRLKDGGGLQAGLGWLVLLAVLVSAVGLGGNRQAVWLPLAGVLGLALLLQSISDLRDPAAGRALGRLWPAALCYLGALGWAGMQAGQAPFDAWAHPAWEVLGVTGSISAAPEETWAGLVRLIAYGAAFWVAARAAQSTVRANRMIDAVALFGTLLAIYGLVAWATGQNVIVGEPAYPDFVTATYVNRNAYAMYAALGCMACVTAIAMRMPDPAEGLALSVARREMLETMIRTAWPYTLGALLAGLAMLLTGSRAGTFCGMLGVSIVVLSMVGRHLGRRTAFFVLLMLLAAPAFLAPILIERIAGLDPMEDLRLEVYAMIISGLADRPWLGHGLGTFQDTFRAYLTGDAASLEWDKAHSTYLENAWELGMPAAGALVLAVLVILAQIAAGLGKRRRMRPLLVLALAAGLASGLHAGVDFSLQMPATAALFAMILGIGWGVAGRPQMRRANNASWDEEFEPD
ncbi:MAG: O-antigen ligase family protein [Paracoccaceae bacterium]